MNLAVLQEGLVLWDSRDLHRHGRTTRFSALPVTPRHLIGFCGVYFFVVRLFGKEKVMQRVASVLMKSLGFLLVFAAFESRAFGFDPFPEIDPGSMTSAVALLTGGVLLLTDRLHRK
jgi:hypothetical protein